MDLKTNWIMSWPLSRSFFLILSPVHFTFWYIFKLDFGAGGHGFKSLARINLSSSHNLLAYFYCIYCQWNLPKPNFLLVASIVLSVLLVVSVNCTWYNFRIKLHHEFWASIKDYYLFLSSHFERLKLVQNIRLYILFSHWIFRIKF